MRGTRQPSKFMSLERLKRIRQDHYLGANGVDYDAPEVDKLIFIKQTLKADREINLMYKEQDEYEAYIYG